MSQLLIIQSEKDLEAAAAMAVQMGLTIKEVQRIAARAAREQVKAETEQEEVEAEQAEQSEQEREEWLAKYRW